MAQEVLAGRHALVTGGAQGLGAGMAQALAAAGAKVMIGDVQEDLAAQTASEIGGHSTRLDVTDEASWEAAIAKTIQDLGGFDILVNNAGIEISSLIVDAQAEDLKRMLEVNVLGTALGIKHGLKAMRPNGPAGNGGAIVNVSSVAATIAFPGHLRLLRHQIGRRQAHPGLRVRGRQARLRRPRELRLPRPRAHRDGSEARGRHGRARPVRISRGGGRRGRRADAARAPR